MNLRPSYIFYTQDSISNRFGWSTSHSNMYIGETLDALINGLATVNSIPRIGVFWQNGKWFTKDNRRLWVFRKAEELGIVDVITVDIVPKVEPIKFTTFNNGSSVRVRRNDPGGVAWRRFSAESIRNQSQRQIAAEQSEPRSNEYTDNGCVHTYLGVKSFWTFCLIICLVLFFAIFYAET